MVPSVWPARAGLGCFATALILTSPILAQTSTGKNAAFITQLKAQFKKMDLNEDTFLDKNELAKAFRGPKATAPAQGMYDDQGRLTKTYYEASKKYPDLVFLWAADTDANDRLSWQEYESYQLKLLANQQQQQKALQRAVQSASRSVATRSRRTGGRYSRYRGRSSRYSRSSHHVNYAQRSMYYQQRQMMLAAQNWQRMQMLAMMNYQRMYQQAIQQRLMMQRAMMANYLRQQQQAAAHRVVQRHQNPASRPIARRR